MLYEDHQPETAKKDRLAGWTISGYTAAGSLHADAYATDKPLPIYCVDTNQKTCSISFDAAWGDV